MNCLVYGFHGLFWAAFLVRAFRPRGAEAPAGPAPAARQPRAARHPAFLLFFHGIGFGAMYAALGRAVLAPIPTGTLFDLPWPVGGLVILLGAALLAWALWVFGSWRLLAKLDADHRLCTQGPYRHFRHPIYVACDLLAIGTFLWIPTLGMLFALILMLLGGHLRARAEEKLLLGIFGEEYRVYCRATKRYVPRLF